MGCGMGMPRGVGSGFRLNSHLRSAPIAACRRLPALAAGEHHS